MLNLKDGTLWQWDIGRKMIITLEEGSTIDKVQFYNGIGDNAYPATSIEVVDGEILAGIPNSLLCYANNLTVYLMTTDEDGVKTQEQITLVVNKRAKPEDYIFTDDEFHTYKAYDERLQYLEENIVLPDRLKESTDTEVKALVPEWAREAKPDATLTESGKAADAAKVGSDVSALKARDNSLAQEIVATKQLMSSPYNFKGSVESFDELPITENKVNDTYYVVEEKLKFSWNGSEWYQSSMNESDYQEELNALREGKAGLRVCATFNANDCTEVGTYFVSSSDGWINVPESGGVLNVLVDNNALSTRLYQQFYSYQYERLYIRHMVGGTFTEWTLISSEFDFNLKETNLVDLNNYNKIGMYKLTSDTEYLHSPFGAKTGGIVLVFTDRNGGITCLYQIAIPYNSANVKIRCSLANGTFTEWSSLEGKVPNSLETQDLFDCNLDDVIDTAFFFISTAFTYENLPEPNNGALLLNFNRAISPYRHYQIYQSYSSGRLFYRNKMGESWSSWKRLVTFEDTKEFFIQKVSDTSLYIYKRGSKGYIRYEYLNQINESTNLNTWKIGDIYLCGSTAMEPIKEISSRGADQEGVLKLYGEADYIGGVHGDEQYTDFALFVDGTQYTMDTLVDMWASEIRVIVNSNITHCDTTNVCMTKNKQTTFDKDGVHVNNRWTLLEDVTLEHVRAILLSVNKNCMTKYYDSVVNTFPMDVPESGGGIYNNNMIDTYYMGEISAHVWCGERGGDESMYRACIADFGTRLKSYFDCYTGYPGKAGEQLHCQNNFNITC